MKRYSKYKDSDVEWIGEIPDHWENVQLKRSLISVSNGTTANQVDYVTDYPVSRIETISSGKIDINRVGYLDKKDVEDKFILKKGDIILSHINSLEYVGNCAIYDSQYLLIHGMNLLRLQPNQKTTPKFLIYYLKGYNFKIQIQANSKHAINQVSLPASSLKSLRISFPPLTEQQSIANYLDHKTHQIDTLMEKKQKQIDLLKEHRAALINHAVTKGLNPNVEMKDSGIEGLGEIPAHWEVKKLKYVTTKIGDGIHATPEYTDDSDIYFINGNNLDQGCIILRDNTKCVSENEYEKYKVYIKSGTILISINGTIGNLAFYKDERVIIGKSAAYIECMDELNNEFVYYLLQSQYIQVYFEKSLSGTTIKNLSLFALQNTKILITSLEEQDGIVAHIKKEITQTDSTLNKYEKQIAILEEYRTTLISDAVTGKIDVRNEVLQ